MNFMMEVQEVNSTEMRGLFQTTILPTFFSHSIQNLLLRRSSPVKKLHTQYITILLRILLVPSHAMGELSFPSNASLIKYLYQLKIYLNWFLSQKKKFEVEYFILCYICASMQNFSQAMSGMFLQLHVNSFSIFIYDKETRMIVFTVGLTEINLENKELRSAF